MTAEAVGVYPTGKWNVARGEDRADGNGDGQQHDATEGLKVTASRDQADAPDQKAQWQTIGRPSQCAMQRICNRGPNQAKRIGRGGVCRREEAGITPVICPEQQETQNTKQDKDCTTGAQAPGSQLRCRFLLEKRRGCLAAAS